MGIFIGIDLGGTSIKGGKIENGNIVKKEFILIKQNSTGSELFEDIITLISRLWSEDVQGIGLAVPALINFESGIIYGLSNITQLNDFPVREEMQKCFGVPVLMQNDANCFVLGEKHFGLAKGSQNVVGLITGTGVGAGIIVNNQIYNGTNCGAGEFGMISFKDRNFEKYCSGQFFTEIYRSSGENLAKRAREGDLHAQEAFDAYGSNLGELIKLICYTLDPELIILGGSVSQSFPLYESSLNKTLQSYYFNTEKEVRIVPTEMADIAILGAVSLFYK